MYDVDRRKTGWIHETRCICIWSCNKMVALGHVYTLGKQTLYSIVQVEMPPALSS